MTTSAHTSVTCAARPLLILETCQSTLSFTQVSACELVARRKVEPFSSWGYCLLLSGEKPFLCDKCGRGFNRVDNLRSHVKTVHHGKAGMKRLVVAGEGMEEVIDACTEASTSENQLNIVTVTSEDIVTTLANGAVAQLTGQEISLWSGDLCLGFLLIYLLYFLNPPCHSNPVDTVLILCCVCLQSCQWPLQCQQTRPRL